jgi:uncharacterized protein YukE
MTSRTIGSRTRRALLMGAAVMVVAGCAAPPSVTPLLRVTHAVLEDEAQRLAADAERVAQRHERQRADLAAAFERDLRERRDLDEAWVGEAVRVYVAAREAVTAQAADTREAYADRIDNLRAAGEAQERAVILLEHQRRALPWPEGVSGWELRDRIAGFLKVDRTATSKGEQR